MNTQNKNENNSMSLYLNFHSLSVKQYCTILSAIENITIEVTKILNSYELLSLIDDDYIFLSPDFLIEEIHTGDSIYGQFKLGKGILPKRSKDEAGKQIYEIPEWAAAVSLAGTILAAGLTGYKTILEIKKLRLENAKLQFELKTLREGKSEEKNESLNKIKINLMIFYNEIEKNNFNSAKINNVLIKGGDNE